MNLPPRPKLLVVVQPRTPHSEVPFDLLRAHRCLPVTPTDSDTIITALEHNHYVGTISLVTERSSSFDPADWLKADWEVVSVTPIGDPLEGYYFILNHNLTIEMAAWLKPDGTGNTLNLAEAGIFDIGAADRVSLNKSHYTPVPVPLAYRYAIQVIAGENMVAAVEEAEKLWLKMQANPADRSGLKLAE